MRGLRVMRDREAHEREQQILRGLAARNLVAIDAYGRYERMRGGDLLVLMDERFPTDYHVVWRSRDQSLTQVLLDDFARIDEAVEQVARYENASYAPARRKFEAILAEARQAGVEPARGGLADWYFVGDAVVSIEEDDGGEREQRYRVQLESGRKSGPLGPGEAPHEPHKSNVTDWHPSEVVRSVLAVSRDATQ